MVCFLFVMSDPVGTPAPSPELGPPAALTPPPQAAEGAEAGGSAAEEEASVSSQLPVASPCSSTDDPSNTSNGTSSATETAMKAVSEGELLSHVQLEDTLTGIPRPPPHPFPPNHQPCPPPRPPVLHSLTLSSLSAEETLCTLSLSLQDMVSIVHLQAPGPSAACTG